MRPDSFLFYQYNVRALVAVIMVSVICGAIGSQVVGNRMAFFSDALAHCGFAGFAVGFLLFLAVGIAREQFLDWVMLMMVLFGVLIGALIALVHETTGLPSDTVIGVFFAGAIGFGAIVMRAVRNVVTFDIESFIFGDPTTVRTVDLVYLFALLLVTIVFLALMYNRLVLTSVNPSLALSRGVSVRLCRYLFVILLGVVVNLCLFVVGMLLINALLIVPAAAASNLCRNLRQLFWCSIGLSLASGLGGLLLSWELSVRDWKVGTGGTIVGFTVVFFIASMIIGPALRRRRMPLAA
jgi:zinc transport system permease protein